MFWAFLFFIDFRIGFDNVHIDVLPDFVGWVLFAAALGSISDLSPRVRGLRSMALWLVVLSLFEVVEIRLPISSGTVNTWMSPFFPIGMIATILGIVFIWKLCELIMAMAEVTGNAMLHDQADFRRKLYAGLMVALALFFPVALLAPPLAVVAVVVAFPLSIIVFILMMGLMSSTEKMCHGRWQQ